MLGYPKNLKGKILFYCFTFTVVLLFIIIMVCLTSFNNLAKLNNIQTISYNLNIAMDNIETNVCSVVNVAHWASVNDYISAFASASNTYPNDLKFKKLTAYNALKNHIYGLGVDTYINKAIIYSEKGHFIQFGSIYGDRSDIDTCLSFPYFDLLKNSNIIKWIGIFDDPFINRDSVKSVPIMQSIYADNQKDPLGWVYISMSTDVITDFLVQYEFDKGSELYLIMGDKTYNISHRQGFIELNQEPYGFTIKEFNSYKNTKYVEFDEGEIPRTAVFYTSNKLGWTLVQTLPNNHFALQDEVYTSLLCVIISGVLVLAILIILTMNRMINKPIQKILNQMENISLGDFSYNPSIESEDEIGRIGIGINTMAQDIKKLINKQIKDEKAKKDLELRMLQNQINPHFLYNTLNSIKWMATIQNSKGIAEMASSLSMLLKNIATGTDELISVEQEINILNEYCKIQQYRYGGLFSVNYHFEDVLLRKCKIIKFTLQPIVENSIFHGIEPKGTKGVIDIYITRPSEGILKIYVKDNGVGMSEEQIEMLLNGANDKRKEFNNIGIKNVDERIKLSFGNQYGIKIKSVLGEYTKVIISLPFKLE